MIDFKALQKQFDTRIPAFFASRTSQITEMQRCWFEQLRGKSWQELAQMFSGISQCTSWQGPIDAHSAFGKSPDSYSVFGVDGSQIYADRHQGLPWSLITISKVCFTYTPTSGKATFATIPVLLSEYQEPSVLDARRSMLELQKGVEVLLADADPSQQQILLFDGPLSPSFGKDDIELKFELSAQFKTVLTQCYQHNIIIAGYTSAPRARDLVRLLELVARSDRQLDQLVDSDLVALFLQQGQYSTYFSPTISSLELEPPLRLGVIYAHVGSEIVRVELPAYLAQDPHQRSLIMSVLFDQVKKGYGYPAVLAEAHEHAVVREADRQLFFQLARRKADELGMHTAASHKSIKKRFPLV